jgi:hypothetical protein
MSLNNHSNDKIHPNSNGFSFRSALVVAVFQIVLAMPANAQATTFTYTGQVLTDLTIESPSGICPITVSFTAANPAPPNYSGSIGNTSFSISDCVNSITSSQQLLVQTNAKEIIGWTATALENVSVPITVFPVDCSAYPSCTMTANQLQLTTVNTGGTAGDSVVYGVLSGGNELGVADLNSNAPGTWTCSPTCVAPSLIILSPSANDTYPVGGSEYNIAGPITFRATTPNSSEVSWTLDLTYTTSGGKCAKCTNAKSLKTKSGADGMESYKSMGGQLVATAADDLNDTANVTVYVVGAPVPLTTEVTLLDSIYPGPTSNLLSGIAFVESSLQQFAQLTNFGIDNYWPTESYDGGTHIGLMQLPVAMGVAWDYSTNAGHGEKLFATKVATATRLMNTAIATYPGLPTLTGVNLENMALVLYGPYAKAGIANQYYVPSCQGGTGKNCTGGTWVWVVNTADNPNGVAYANKCRASVR